MTKCLKIGLLYDCENQWLIVTAFWGCCTLFYEGSAAFTFINTLLPPFQNFNIRIFNLGNFYTFKAKFSIDKY